MLRLRLHSPKDLSSCWEVQRTLLLLWGRKVHRGTLLLLHGRRSIGHFNQKMWYCLCPRCQSKAFLSVVARASESTGGLVLAPNAVVAGCPLLRGRGGGVGFFVLATRPALKSTPLVLRSTHQQSERSAGRTNERSIGVFGSLLIRSLGIWKFLKYAAIFRPSWK